MSNFFSAIITRNLDVLFYEGDSHKVLIQRAGLKDNKFVDMEFVKIEVPDGDISQFWEDEVFPFPEWYDRDVAKEKCKEVLELIMPARTAYEEIRIMAKNIYHETIQSAQKIYDKEVASAKELRDKEIMERLNSYHDAIVSAQKPETVKSIWEIYTKSIKWIWRCYDENLKLALKVYNVMAESIQETYKETIEPAKKQYEDTLSRIKGYVKGE